MEILQTKLQEDVEALQTLQKQQTKALTARQTLDSQLTENKLVKEELEGLEDGSKVFKLIGPALVRQEWPCTLPLSWCTVFSFRLKDIFLTDFTDWVLSGLERSQAECGEEDSVHLRRTEASRRLDT